MIVLAPMTAPEFDAYLERAIPAFARDKVESGQWSAESSLELARQAYVELLPDGLATPEHFLCTLRDGADERTVGVLWYAIQERAGRRIAYVYDVLIERPFRRLGYASQAFEAFEGRVASSGLAGIALHVFGHNRAAQALYAKLGYHPTNIDLFKRLSSART